MSSSANRSRSMPFAKPFTSCSMPHNAYRFVRFGRCLGLTVLLSSLSCSSARAEFFEDVHKTLSLGDSDHFRLQLSGLIDLETYFIDPPAPGLIYTDDDVLFNPRLT